MPARSDQPAPIYAVAGTEDLLKRQAIDRIVRGVLGDADRSLAMSEYECATSIPELASVLDDLRTLSLLSDRRLVLVREADKFISQYREGLEKYAAAPSSSGVLLIECKTMPGNTRLARQIAKVGEVIKCEPLKPFAVPGWIVQHAREGHGVQIDQQAAGKLASLVGNDLGLLDSELVKCVIYIGDRKRIAVADIDALVGQQKEEQVWNILEAVADGDTRAALQLWEDVCQTDRAAEHRSIVGIAFSVRRLLKAKRAEEAGASLQQLKGELWVRDDRQARRQLAAFTTAQVEEILARLLEADVAAKTGMASVRASIERLIVEMSQSAGRRRHAV